MLVQECTNSYTLQVVQFETAFSTSAVSFEAISMWQDNRSILKINQNTFYTLVLYFYIQNRQKLLKTSVSFLCVSDNQVFP